MVLRKGALYTAIFIYQHLTGQVCQANLVMCDLDAGDPQSQRRKPPSVLMTWPVIQAASSVTNRADRRACRSRQKARDRNLISFRLDVNLPWDHAAGVVGRGQQVPPRLARRARSAQRRAVRRDRAPEPVRCAAGHRCRPRCRGHQRPGSARSAGTWTHTAAPPVRSPGECAAVSSRPIAGAGQDVSTVRLMK